MGLRADVALPENIESPTGMDHNSLPMGFLDSTPPKVTSPPGGKSIQQQTNGFHSIPKSEERPSLLEATNGLIARSAPCVPHFANREGYGHLPTSQALHVQVNGHTKSGQSQQESGPSTWLDSGSTSLMSAPSPAVTKTTVDDQLKTASVSDLNKALEVFRPKVPAKVAAVHDDNPRPGPSNVGRREEGRGEEVQKRRVIADKIDKTKAHSHFNFFMSHFDTMNSTQLAINLRRLIRKRVADVVLPSAVLRHTLCEDPPPHSAPVTTATASSAAIERDDEATDLETEDNNDQTGTLRELFYERQHARAIATEQRILGGILSIDDEIGEIVEQLAKHKAMKTSFGSLEDTNEDAGCARARPALVHGRFNFLKEEQKKIRPDYFLHEPSTSRVQAYVAAGARIPSIEATDNDIPMEERMQTRLLHLGTAPSFTLRNRLRTPLWKLNTEMVEEQRRCGMKRSQQREEEREEKRRRREERAEKRTEETDHPRYSEDSDEDYVPGSKSRSHGIVKTKSRRGRKPGSSKPARDVPLQLIKLGRRPSTASTFRPRTSTLNDIDDVVFDTSLTGLPAKIDYKEIPIPDWKVETEPSWADSLAEDPCSFCAAGEPLKVEIAARHHPIEFSERRRFQAFRARAAEAAQKREEGEDRSRENTEERLREEEEDDDLVAAPVLLTPPSKISNLNFSSSSLDEPMLMEVPAVVPPFDPLPFLSPEKTVPDYERLSSCAPYPPRTFVL